MQTKAGISCLAQTIPIPSLSVPNTSVKLERQEHFTSRKIKKIKIKIKKIRNN